MKEVSNGLGLAVKAHWKQLKSKQKAFFAVFIFCATVALVFSYYSVRQGVTAPWQVSIADIQKQKDLLKDPTQVQEETAKRIDTDGDGLSDYDEENVYHTSPYLWSTAGDNVPDNVKIALGENPLCKHGEECDAAAAMKFDLPTTTYPGADLLTNNVQNDLGNIIMGDSQVGQNIRQTASDACIDMSLSSVIPRDPAMLRTALLQTGQVTQADLDAISDAQLLQYFDDAQAELIKQNPNLAATSTGAAQK
ncbi:MAG: hypothetical protein WCT54_00450 [Patescibacteria group bacterium]